MTTKEGCLIAVLIGDLIAILLDQLVHKKIAGWPLGLPYYIYLTIVTIVFGYLIYQC